MYTAMLLSGNDEYDPTKSGFKTEQEAEDYIGEHICSVCAEEVKNGGFLSGYENDGWQEIGGPLETACGEEWCIITDEQFEQLCKKAEDESSEFVNPTQAYLTNQYEKYKVDKDTLRELIITDKIQR